jgi:hypothetical protein
MLAIGLSEEGEPMSLVFSKGRGKKSGEVWYRMSVCKTVYDSDNKTFGKKFFDGGEFLSEEEFDELVCCLADLRVRA